MKTLEIGGVDIAPGQQCNIDLPLADLYTRSVLTMPVRVIRGKRDGPCVFISAALHGDELNGVEILRRVLRHRALGKLRGTLIAVPVVNVHGFISRSRYLPDRRDLNRSFPGRETGSLAARMAHVFQEEVVRKADFGIDLHTGAVHRSNFPQVRGDLSQPGVEELAASFCAPLVLDSTPAEGTLRAFTHEEGIPVIVYEAGEALRFDEASIRVGVAGVINVLRHKGLLSPSRRKSPRRPTVFARGSTWVRAPGSGVIRTLVALGEEVESGQPLGYIADSYGDDEKPLLAPCAGIVIGKLNLPLVFEGEAVYHIARTRRAGAVVEHWELIQSDDAAYPLAGGDEPPIA